MLKASRIQLHCARHSQLGSPLTDNSRQPPYSNAPPTTFDKTDMSPQEAAIDGPGRLVSKTVSNSGDLHGATEYHHSCNQIIETQGGSGNLETQVYPKMQKKVDCPAFLAFFHRFFFGVIVGLHILVPSSIILFGNGTKLWSVGEKCRLIQKNESFLLLASQCLRSISRPISSTSLMKRTNSSFHVFLDASSSLKNRPASQYAEAYGITIGGTLHLLILFRYTGSND